MVLQKNYFLFNISSYCIWYYLQWLEMAYIHKWQNLQC